MQSTFGGSELPYVGPLYPSAISAPSAVSALSESIAPSASVSQIIKTPPLDILNALDIPLEQTDRSNMNSISLAESYKRYKTIVRAHRKYKELQEDGTWKTSKFPKMRETDIIELCVGKTLWYNHWNVIFPPVASHSVMMNWLEGNSAARSNFEVWGMEKLTYDKKDLRIWIEKQAKKGKVKRGKAKEKKDAAEEKAESSTKKKDKHRKSSGSKR